MLFMTEFWKRMHKQQYLDNVQKDLRTHASVAGNLSIIEVYCLGAAELE